MGGDLVRPESGLDRGLKRLMTLIGIVLVATPLAELVVQLTHGERPQILLLGGFCLIGILTVSHANRGRSAPVDRRSEPARKADDRQRAGDALWLPEGDS
jgi:hypothetical protein